LKPASDATDAALMRENVRKRVSRNSAQQHPIAFLAIVLSPLLAVDSGTVFHLTLDPHKLCLFSVTV